LIFYSHTDQIFHLEKGENVMQLEFSLEDKSDIEIKISHMQKELEAVRESADKVRKKLFSQMTEIHKLCLILQNENIDLKQKIGELKNEKTEFADGKRDCLFNV
jgi:cell division septum initiation protein DivIVA